MGEIGGKIMTKAELKKHLLKARDKAVWRHSLYVGEPGEYQEIRRKQFETVVESIDRDLAKLDR